MKGSLKKHVEGKIFQKKQYMIIGNLEPDEFTLIKRYCEDKYDGNRKLMILDLINYKNGETPLRIFDDKITLIYNEFSDRLIKMETAFGAMMNHSQQEEEPVKKTRATWKGFDNHD